MSSRLTTLPLELLLCVLDAVSWSNRKDRAHAVRIALVCRALYGHLKPRLYRVLVVTRDNLKFFENSDMNVLNDVLPHVQSLHYVHSQGEMVFPRLTALWGHWTPSASAGVLLDLPWTCIEEFAAHPGFVNVRGLDISYKALEPAAEKLRTVHSAVTVTRLVGFVPCSRYHANGLRDWAARIASGLAELTHLGLKITDDEEEDDPQGLWGSYPVENIRDALDVFTRDCPKLQRISLRIGGPMALCDPASTPLAGMLRELNDRRVTVSFEPDEDCAYFLCPDDVWAGIDFWSPERSVLMWDVSR